MAPDYGADESLKPRLADILVTDSKPRTLSDDILRQVLAQGPDGLLLCDENGTIVFVNDALCRLTGYEPDQLVGRSVDILVPNQVRARHVELRANYGADPKPRPMGRGLALTAMRADGQEFSVEISLSPVDTPGHPLTIASSRDISERLEEAERLRSTQEMLTLSSERERIARDLHDTVLQRLFGLGLELQAVAMSEPSESGHRLETAVDEIDTIIKEIRTSVFTLGAARREGSLGQELGDIIAQSARVLGFSPRLNIQGPLENLISPLLRPDLTAALREALANVARHSRATAVFVDIIVQDYSLVVRVVDNGLGLPADIDVNPGNGLRNLRTRAEVHGGSCVIESTRGAGTRITWSVPLL
jgi:two-component system sensor histidine kinase DevS